MKFYSASLIASASCVFALSSAHADSVALKHLTQKQQDQIALGYQVSTNQANIDSKSPFDEITVYQLVNATPEESLALFTQYNRHEEFFKSMIDAETATDNVSTAMIKYAVNVQILMFNFVERYEMVDTVSRDSKIPGGYEVSWKLAHETEHTLSSTGSVRFLPFDSKTTLMIYTSDLTPRVTWANSLALHSDAAKNFSNTTVRGLSDQLKKAVENEKKVNNADLQEKIKIILGRL